jgi:hypothetical protein
VTNSGPAQSMQRVCRQLVRADRGVRARHRDEDQKQAEHHRPHRGTVGSETRSLVPADGRSPNGIETIAYGTPTRRRDVRRGRHCAGGRPVRSVKHRGPMRRPSVGVCNGAVCGNVVRGTAVRRSAVRRSAVRGGALRQSAAPGTGVPGFAVARSPIGWKLAEGLAIEFLPPRCHAPAGGARRNASWGHVTILFRLLTGLADGLAPKEWRYARGAIRPNNMGPPLPPLAQVASGAGIQLVGPVILTAKPDGRRAGVRISYCKERDWRSPPTPYRQGAAGDGARYPLTGREPQGTEPATPYRPLWPRTAPPQSLGRLAQRSPAWCRSPDTPPGCRAAGSAGTRSRSCGGPAAPSA